ncbi:MAG: nucleotidyltransferase, partial [Clostridia bacterium]|nr:nucleotidyltransferase [Clostridia bacterium]
MTLVIMAAGMGSRYGGLKQIDPVTPHGEFIVDFSIFDAIKAGFDKVVFIIKEENYDIFRETVGSRIEGSVKVEYAFQKMENIPEGESIPEGRTKPWGTAHAVLSAKNCVNEPFAVINADDFYGRDAYQAAADYLDAIGGQTGRGAMIGYKMRNTVSANGHVTRGVCETD